MSLICAVEADKFNDLLLIDKSSGLPLDEIDKLRKLFLWAFFDPSLIVPDLWEFWRRCITKFRIFDIGPFAGWLGIANALHKAHVITPNDLAPLIFSECKDPDVVDASWGIPSYCGNGPYVGGMITLRKSPFPYLKEQPDLTS